MKPSIDVIIPVYKPDGGLRQLLKGLMEQTLLPEHILLVNTEESYFDPSVLEGIRNVQVIHIKKREFDHGGTRHMAAEMLQGEFLLFMTQDAQPADRFLLEKLYRPFSQKRSVPPMPGRSRSRAAGSWSGIPEALITEARIGFKQKKTCRPWELRLFFAPMYALCIGGGIMRPWTAFQGRPSLTRI